MTMLLSLLRVCEEKRVRMRFDDGCEYIATLLSATQDMDGSLHLIYERIEWTNDPAGLVRLKDRAWHAEGKRLMSIETIDALT